jgi:hypothetical protein
VGGLQCLVEDLETSRAHGNPPETASARQGNSGRFQMFQDLPADAFRSEQYCLVRPELNRFEVALDPQFNPYAAFDAGAERIEVGDSVDHALAALDSEQVMRRAHSCHSLHHLFKFRAGSAADCPAAARIERIIWK